MPSVTCHDELLPNTARILCTAVGIFLGFELGGAVLGHDHSRSAAERARIASLTRADARAEQPADPAANATCEVTLRIQDATRGGPLPALVQVTNLASGKAIPLPQEIRRELNWYSVAAESRFTVPRTRIQIEAFHGLETERVVREIDLSSRETATVELSLRRIFDSRERHLVSGNTHLHLMKMSHLEAIRYLQLVPRSDGLDLVFLSHLRRIPDERDYISNRIVEESFRGGELQRLSTDGLLFGNGQEHRHNFGPGGEGFGHVMLLNLKKLIHPVSIGPGIMAEGTDGRPLQRGILEARGDGATIVWCHNRFGYEAVPNWTAGLVHAQNIFDGGPHGSYEDTFYRFLNLGMKVPFSTGTDWFVYDFSRVYVPLRGPVTVPQWLQALQEGRSVITNGPLLELTVQDRPCGETLQLKGPTELRVRARGIGRHDFRGLELVHNGQVVRTVASHPAQLGYEAEAVWTLAVSEPGWLALRIPLVNGQNEFEKPLFAHTSAIDWEVRGRRIFQAAVAEALIREGAENIAAIEKQARFADDAEREAVLQVHRAGLANLRERLAAAAQSR